MDTRRIGLATAVVAISTLSACAMWQDMTGRGPSSDTARTTRSTPSSGAPGGTYGTYGATDATGGATMSGTPVPGADVSLMRGPSVPATAGRGMPTFRSYNECRAWLAQQGRALNRGPAIGGEVSMADMDPCRNQPRS